MRITSRQLTRLLKEMLKATTRSKIQRTKFSLIKSKKVRKDKLAMMKKRKLGAMFISVMIR